MESLNTLIRMMECIFQGTKTVKQLSEACNLSIDDTFDIIRNIFRQGLDGYWGLEIYDENMNQVEEPGSFAAKPDNLEIMCILDEDKLEGIYELNDLSFKERWAIYDLSRECNGEFIAGEREKILSFYNPEFADMYSSISSRRIIKQVVNIFNFSEETGLTIYESIRDKKYINIELLKGASLNHAAPLRMYYNDDLKNWYLEYRKKKNVEFIRVDHIKSIEVLEESYKIEVLDEYYWGYGKKPLMVKLRVYDEKNAKEISMRFLSRKNIIFTRRGEGYFDMTVSVTDVNLFKRWARTMGPQVVVLSPQFLKEDMKTEIKKWLENYQ